MGYDAHSVVMDPGFVNNKDLVPANRLDYGTDPGPEWEYGLKASPEWIAGKPPDTTRQNGKWQAGAIVYGSSSSIKENVDPVQNDLIIFPNHPDGNMIILIKEPNLVPDFMRIINTSGSIVFEDKIKHYLKEFEIKINLNKGTYYVQFSRGDTPVLTQEIIVNQ